MNFSRNILRYILSLLILTAVSCKQKSEPEPGETKEKIDSVVEEGAEKVKESNQGVKEGYDEAKDEIEEIKDSLDIDKK